jgi:hypothetical protein
MLANTSHECNTVSPIVITVVIIITLHQHAQINRNDSPTFKKMIQTAIPGNLKFRPNAHGSTTRLSNDDTLNDTFHISLYYFLSSDDGGTRRKRVTWKSIAH